MGIQRLFLMGDCCGCRKYKWPCWCFFLFSLSGGVSAGLFVYLYMILKYNKSTFATGLIIAFAVSVGFILISIIWCYCINKADDNGGHNSNTTVIVNFPDREPGYDGDDSDDSDDYKDQD